MIAWTAEIRRRAFAKTKAANRLWRTIGAVYSIFLVFTTAAWPQENPVRQQEKQLTLRFCYQDTDLYPNYTGKGSKRPDNLPGVNIELLELATARAGVSLEYFRFSWNRCMALLAVSRVDSVIASYNSERAVFAEFPIKDGTLDTDKRITTSGYYLYHRGSTPFWDGDKFVDPSIMVAAPTGYSIVRRLREKNIEVIEAGTTDSLLNMLRVGRIDAIAAPGSTADTFIRHDITRYSMITKDPAPLKESPYFVVFSKAFARENPETVNSIWAALPSLREEFHDRILAKY